VKRERLDWLDRVARAAGGGTRGSARRASAQGSKRVSRGTFVKAAITGAASVSLSLAGKASAEPPSRSKCTDDCWRRYEAAFERDLRTCWAAGYGRARPSWGNYVRIAARSLIFGGPEIVKANLVSFCGVAAYDRRMLENANCQAECRQTCTTPLRALQGAFSRRDACSPTTPEQAQPPAAPPAPDSAKVPDPCFGCTGYCCAPCPDKGYGSCLTVSVVDGKPYGTCDC
jgi:hypothetical protein